MMVSVWPRLHGRLRAMCSLGFVLLLSVQALASRGEGVPTGVVSRGHVRWGGSSLVAAGEKRQKVGLILSGGGAKGLAHIGVLRYLEERGVRPDFIAGTSMGAIIGGLYACGYTAQQLEELVAAQDWNRLLSSSHDLSEIDADLKPTVEREQLLLAWRDGRFQIPLGILEGRNLWTLFQTLTWPRALVRRFDDLDIPFRCVAVNLRKARLREFSEGSLPFAIRASMAIPGAFTPVSLGDTALYVDGGVMDNFPYRTLHRMGAEVVLGSYVGPLPVTDSSVFSPRDILVRASMFAGMIRAFDEMRKCDVLFTPEVSKVGVLDFSDAKRTIAHGYEEAERRFSELGRHGVGEVRAGRLRRTDTLDRERANWVDRVEVVGVEPRMARFLRRRMELSTPSAITASQLRHGLQRLYSSRLVRQADYHLDSSGTLRVEMQMLDRTALGVAANINSEWGASLLLRLRTPSPFRVIGRTQTDVEVSTQPRIQTSHYLYFSDRMDMLLNVGAYYSSSRLPFYRSTQKVADIWEHLFEVEATYGHLVHRNALAEGGMSWQAAWQFPNEAYILWLEQSTGRILQREFSLFARGRYNSVDRHYYPTRGIRFFCRLNYAFRSELHFSRRFASFDGGASLNQEFGKAPQSLSGIARFEIYRTIAHPRFVALGSAYLGIYTSSVGRFSGFRIGGMEEVQRSATQDIPFYGLGYRQLTTNNALIVSAGIRVNGWREFYGTARASVLAHSLRTSEFLESLFTPSEYVMGYSASVGWRTRLGVMEGTIAGNSRARLPWFYFHLGIPF